MPPRVRSKARRPAERDYSHRSLLDKLGVKTEQRIAVLGIDDASFLSELGRRVSGYLRQLPQESMDLILVAAEATTDLPRLKALAKAIEKNGAVWVIYPKGRQQIREVDVIAAGKSAGLVDNKVCRFSDTHTALRLVIPLSKR
ncbi:MAG TPA: hypothetical protein VEJ67_00475 [Candidatus Cybelea sp.]|nr:hypothetical protein [Candidatus Cybelea sp.]